METGVNPKKIIHEISEFILECFSKLELIDNYDVYQHLMDYWSEVMQDDCYIISDNGWKAELTMVKKTKSAEIWDCELVPKYLVINRYFDAEKSTIEGFEVDLESIKAAISEMEEEHGVEDGLMAEAKNDKDSITTASVKERMKKIKGSKEDAAEYKLLTEYLKLNEDKTELNRKIVTLQKELEEKVMAKYKVLTIDEVKTLVVDDKWMQHLDHSVHNEMQRISQALTQRIKELAERYETPMPLQLKEVKSFEEKVNAHLEKMGFVWS